MVTGSIVATALVIFVLLSLVVFVANESTLLRDVTPYESTWPHPNRETAQVVLDDGRAFDDREWEAVERTHSYLAANPEACVDDLLLDVRPLARCGRLSPRAWWADVVAPGLAAETDVDLDAVRAGEREAPSTALRERASDLPGFGDATAFRPAYALTRPRDEPAFGATLPGPFAVADVDVTSRRVLVEGADDRAAFDVVDRDGDLAVAPASGSYRREDVAGPAAEWFVDAANALESALPAQFDALDDAASPWPAADGSPAGAGDETPAVVTPAERGPTVDAFDCTVHGRPDATTSDDEQAADAPPTDESRTMVDVAAGDDRTALLVGDDGVVRFPSVDARRGHDRTWATRAVAAADVAVQHSRDPEPILH
ncbi:hypothetical protein [Halorubellus sp. PRR65]|uniref:hypothetical protein n=1 Tax=Halorubellus sp. PRR65 TaxID=3098148 RepID=UPI002B25A074|nr:hypothetical protein [Halorubellus sp. PRR65]